MDPLVLGRIPSQLHSKLSPSSTEHLAASQSTRASGPNQDWPRSHLVRGSRLAANNVFARKSYSIMQVNTTAVFAQCYGCSNARKAIATSVAVGRSLGSRANICTASYRAQTNF